MGSLCHWGTFYTTCFFVPTYINKDCFQIHCNACLIVLPNISLCKVLTERLLEKSETMHWSVLKASKQAFKEQTAQMLPPSLSLEWMISNRNPPTNCTLSSFIMFTTWLDGEQSCDLVFAFTVYSIVQCLWKRQKSLEYCALSLFLLLWNVTVQFELCILKIHSFLLYIYLYVFMYVCTEKKENKCLFFIMSLHVLITKCVLSFTLFVL